MLKKIRKFLGKLLLVVFFIGTPLVVLWLLAKNGKLNLEEIVKEFLGIRKKIEDIGKIDITPNTVTPGEKEAKAKEDVKTSGETLATTVESAEELLKKEEERRKKRDADASKFFPKG